MDLPLKITLISVCGGGSFGIAIAFLNRFFAIRSARPAAAAVFISKINEAIPYNYEKALNRKPAITLEDLGKFKAHLWFMQSRKINILWRQYEGYQNSYHPDRVVYLENLKKFAENYV